MPASVPTTVHRRPQELFGGGAPPVPAFQPAAGMHVPARSAEDQRAAALRRANEVRSARAAVKRAVHEGLLSVAEVLRHCPSGAETMPVGELLTAQHRWGEARTARLLRRIPVPETKPIGRLTVRQRLALIEALSG